MDIAIAESGVSRSSRPLRMAMTRTRLNQIYVVLIIAAGTVVLVYSGLHLTREQLDIRFLLLALFTVLIGPRLSIPIPRVKAHISVSDTFVFLSLLLFGGEAAVFLATAEALCSSARITTRFRTHLFNASVMACATFITVWTLRLTFGDTLRAHELSSSNYIVVLCLMSFVQYLAN